MEIIAENADKNKIFKNFGQNQDFLRTSTNIEISKNFNQNRNFLKFLPELRFSGIVFTKINIFGNFDLNRDAQKCWPKSNF